MVIRKWICDFKPLNLSAPLESGADESFRRISSRIPELPNQRLIKCRYYDFLQRRYSSFIDKRKL